MLKISTRQSQQHHISHKCSHNSLLSLPPPSGNSLSSCPSEADQTRHTLGGSRKRVGGSSRKRKKKAKNEILVFSWISVKIPQKPPKGAHRRCRAGLLLLDQSIDILSNNKLACFACLQSYCRRRCSRSLDHLHEKSLLSHASLCRRLRACECQVAPPCVWLAKKAFKSYNQETETRKTRAQALQHPGAEMTAMGAH